MMTGEKNLFVLLVLTVGEEDKEGEEDNPHVDLGWSQPKQDAFLLLCYLT